MADPKTDHIGLAAYWDMLNQFDWHYEMSDDGGVWRAGARENEHLNAIARQSPEHAALMRGFRQHHYNGKPWGTEQPPKPQRPK